MSLHSWVMCLLFVALVSGLLNTSISQKKKSKHSEFGCKFVMGLKRSYRVGMRTSPAVEG